MTVLEAVNSHSSADLSHFSADELACAIGGFRYMTTTTAELFAEVFYKDSEKMWQTMLLLSPYNRIMVKIANVMNEWN